MHPWRHYVPRDKDHGNMAEVAAVLRDTERVAEMVANAYAEITLNPIYSYSAMIDQFDERIVELMVDRQRASSHEGGGAKFRSAYPVQLVDNPHELRRAPRVRRLAGRLLRRLGLFGLVTRLRKPKYAAGTVAPAGWPVSA